MKTNDYSQWFRGSTPYISAHRGKTFVVYLGGDALAHPNITNIVHDLALLHVLGVHLVLVHGGSPQLDAALPGSAIPRPPSHHAARAYGQCVRCLRFTAQST